jgi:hypothetical protein
VGTNGLRFTRNRTRLTSPKATQEIESRQADCHLSLWGLRCQAEDGLGDLAVGLI